MRKSLILRSTAILLLAGTAADIGASPGDVVARRALGVPCISSSPGMAFDGKTLYTGDRVTNGKIGRTDVATGADLGLVEVKRDGAPITEWCCSGLEFDPGRCTLWASGGTWLRNIDMTTGEIIFDLNANSQNGGPAVGYNFVEDRVWYGGDNRENVGYCTNPPEGLICEVEVMYSADNGLSFDGVDLWHNTTRTPSASWPGDDGVLYPSNMAGSIDLTRAIDIPGNVYADIAFDCTTFPVPVLWVSNGFACEAIAFEIDSKAACPPAPPLSVLRSSLYDLASRTSRLPFDRTRADFSWRVVEPVAFRDDADGILSDQTRPLVYYQLGGACGTDLGNVLRLAKDLALPAVVVYKRP